MKLAQIYSWVGGNEHDFYQPTTTEDRRTGLRSAGESASQSDCNVQGVNRLGDVIVFVGVLSW